MRCNFQIQTRPKPEPAWINSRSSTTMPVQVDADTSFLLPQSGPKFMPAGGRVPPTWLAQERSFRCPLSESSGRPELDPHLPFGCVYRPRLPEPQARPCILRNRLVRDKECFRSTFNQRGGLVARASRCQCQPTSIFAGSAAKLREIGNSNPILHIAKIRCTIFRQLPTLPTTTLPAAIPFPSPLPAGPADTCTGAAGFSPSPAVVHAPRPALPNRP